MPSFHDKIFVYMAPILDGKDELILYYSYGHVGVDIFTGPLNPEYIDCYYISPHLHLAPVISYSLVLRDRDDSLSSLILYHPIDSGVLAPYLAPFSQWLK